MSSASLKPNPNPSKTVAPFIFGATIALSAFLLFQVQLIIGKAILPWFGGTAAVWTTCMLVFQLLLLGGYAYAHMLSSSLSLRTQTRVHMMVLGIATLALLIGAIYWRAPILPSDAWKPQGTGSPVWQIIRMLFASVGIPFFVLSTTGSLVQRWFAHVSSGSTPYRLYSLSNIGSLLGLVCYPFVVEPLLSLRAQAWMWSSFFIVFGILCTLTARRVGSVEQLPEAEAAPSEEADEEKPTVARYALWLALPACASAMLLATTNHICQDVAVIPFLWIIPLCLYLLSFILTFDDQRWYRRVVFHPLYIAGVIFAVFGLVHEYSIMQEIDIALLAMFAVCMVMHGELVKLRPKTKHLTAFYLMISAGGALGGVFVSIVAPRIFPAFWEYQAALLLCGMLGLCVLFTDRESWLYGTRSGPAIAALLAIAVVPAAGTRWVDADFFRPMIGRRYDLALATIAIFAIYVLVSERKNASAASERGIRWQPVVALLAIAGLGLLLEKQVSYSPDEVEARTRSFFGVRSIFKTDQALALRHGATIHGWQYLDPSRSQRPTSYFTRDTGIGLLMANYPRPNEAIEQGCPGLHVGIIGLGVGTLATYGQTGDCFRFYEIDQKVIDFSVGPQPKFTFLKSSAAAMDVEVGDGRLSLERERPQQYDILVLDAFSSDSVPVHLLTREAMQIYRKHLRNHHSVIAFNITNRLLDLRPVLLGLANNSGMYMVSAGVQRPEAPIHWVLMCDDKDFLLSIPGVRETARTVSLNREAPLWTDDYSNLMQAIIF